jgi:hypothetical protein
MMDKLARISNSICGQYILNQINQNSRIGTNQKTIVECLLSSHVKPALALV